MNLTSCRVDGGGGWKSTVGRRWFVSIVGLLFFCFHTEIFIQAPIPNAIPLAIGLLALVLLIRDVGVSSLYLFALMTAIGWLSCGLAVLRFGSWGAVDSTLYFTVSIWSALGLFLLVRQADPRWIERVVLIAIIFLLLGAILELLLPAFKAVSDGFRVWNFREGFYEAELRDKAMYGLVRPKVFSREPSHVAKNLAIMLLAWHLVRDCRVRDVWILAALFALAFVVTPSPSLLLVPLYVGLLMLTGWNGRPEFKVNSVYIVGLIFCFFLAVALLASVPVLFPESRTASLITGEDQSLFFRVIGPALVAPELLRESPLFGIGIGSDEFMVKHLGIVLEGIRTGASWVSVAEAGNIVHNPIVGMVVYLGLVGSAFLLVCVFVWLYKLLPREAILIFSIWIAYGLTIGGLNTPRFWLPLAFWAACIVSKKRYNLLMAPRKTNGAR